MPEINNEYMAQEQQQASLARVITDAVLEPQMDNGTGQLITDSATLGENLEKQFDHSIFSEFGDQGKAVMGVVARSVNEAITDGAMPDQALLASAANSMQNIIKDSVNLNTTEGVMHRDHMASITLPTLLQQVTIPDATIIPAQHEKTDLYRLIRLAGTTFGGLTEGDEINEMFATDYGTMDTFKKSATNGGNTDGTITAFTVDFGGKLRKGTVMIYIARDVVVTDINGGSPMSAVMPQFSDSTVTVSVDYATGVVTINLGNAGSVGAGLEVAAKADYQIENNESIIPTITHEMEKHTVITHEAAIAVSSTIQSSLQMQREFGLNVNTLNLAAASNVLAAEKDRKNIARMYMFAGTKRTFGIKPNASGSDSTVEAVRLVGQALAVMSNDMMLDTKKSGIQTMYINSAFLGFMEYLSGTDFVKRAGYRPSPQPQLVGTLFGTYRVIHAPQLDVEAGAKALLVGRGRDHADSGLIIGDAIPLISVAHSKQYGRLRDENTMFESGVREIHPYKGRAYLNVLTLDPSTSGLA